MLIRIDGSRVILEEAPPSDASSLCIARRRWRIHRRMPMTIRMRRGTAAPMPAPTSTPVQSFEVFGDFGGGVVVAATTIEGRLAAVTSIEDNEVDSVSEADELDEVVSLSAAAGVEDVDDDSIVD